MTPDPAGIMRGENHLYSYVQNNPLLIIDPMGLLCKQISSTYHTNWTVSEETFYGNWIYERYTQFNIKCWCHFYRDKRIDETHKWETFEYKIYECTEKDECGKDKAYIKIGSGNLIDSGEQVYSKYGGRETKQIFGTMWGAGEGVESGSGCDCQPLSPPPPGLYAN